MSTDQLGRALHDLVDGVEDDARAPEAADLWAGGRRRRRRSRAVSGLAAAAVLALVAGVLWPAGTPRASVPATRVDGEGNTRLTSFPSVVAKPPFVRSTDRPGVTAAVVEERGDEVVLHAVSPSGTVTRLDLPQGVPGYDGVTLSPDGRWLARGMSLYDLVGGGRVPSADVAADLDRAWGSPQQAPWWAPDSRQVFVLTFDQGQPTSTGFALGVDGSVVEAPLLAGGQVPVVAGWLDSDTVLAFLDLTGEGGIRYEARTWTVGDPSWAVAEPDLTWDTEGFDVEPDRGSLSLALSPDRSRLLASMRATDEGLTQDAQTFSFVLDATTGGPVTRAEEPGVVVVPDFDTFLWGGWGCRSGSYREEFLSADTGTSPVTLQSFVTPTEVSSRYDSPCVVFAGDELRGTPVEVAGPWWQDRLVARGPWVAVALGLAVLLWRRRRGGQWREAPRADVPPLPTPTVR